MALLLGVVLLGLASSGIGGGLVLAGLAGLVVSGVALVRGRLDWARLRSRQAGALTGAGSVLLLVLGGVLAPAPRSTPAADSGPRSGASTAASASSTAVETTAVPPVDPLAEPISEAAPGTPLAVLGSLPIHAAADSAGYARSMFGQAWADVDRNGCDTRNDVLRRDLRGVAVKAGTRGCVVLHGRVIDPYTGDLLSYTRGGSSVSIDHVVALADAWRTGAQAWSTAQRVRFANDPLNLLVTSTAANAAKGDDNASGWLPDTATGRCPYVGRQVAVKAKYGLWVTAAERTSMGQVLQLCGSATLPTAHVIPLMPRLTPTTQPPTTKPPATHKATTRATPKRTTTTSAPVEVYYPNCDAVRAAGAAPLHRGDPGYRHALDRDGDGVACE